MRRNDPPKRIRWGRIRTGGRGRCDRAVRISVDAAARASGSRRRPCADDGHPPARAAGARRRVSGARTARRQSGTADAEPHTDGRCRSPATGPGAACTTGCRTTDGTRTRATGAIGYGATAIRTGAARTARPIPRHSRTAHRIQRDGQGTHRPGRSADRRRQPGHRRRRRRGAGAAGYHLLDGLRQQCDVPALIAGLRPGLVVAGRLEYGAGRELLPDIHRNAGRRRVGRLFAQRQRHGLFVRLRGLGLADAPVRPVRRGPAGGSGVRRLHVRPQEHGALQVDRHHQRGCGRPGHSHRLSDPRRHLPDPHQRLRRHRLRLDERRNVPHVPDGVPHRGRRRARRLCARPVRAGLRQRVRRRLALDAPHARFRAHAGRIGDGLYRGVHRGGASSCSSPWRFTPSSRSCCCRSP